MAGGLAPSLSSLAALAGLHLIGDVSGVTAQRAHLGAKPSPVIEQTAEAANQLGHGIATAPKASKPQRHGELRPLRLDTGQSGSANPPGPLELPARVRISPGRPQAVPLGIKANETLGEFVVFMNVPQWLHFSEGTKAATGIWFMPSHLLSSAGLSASGGRDGRYDVTVRALVKGQRKSWEYKLAIEIQRQPASDRKPHSRKPNADRTVSPELEAMVLKRAHAHMAVGNVASARRLYRHLADKGSVVAAFHLAVSYDPKHLKKIGVTGLRGDQAKADHWVKRATDLLMMGKARQLTADEDQQ